MEQPELFRYTIELLERLGVTYFVVGSFASMAYGEPRSTLDIDIVIDPTPEQVEQICDAFPDPDFYVSREAARAAASIHGQFNVIRPDSGNKIDFMIARGDAWSAEQITGRRRLNLLPDRQGFAARPEDVIIGKLIYFKEGGSEKHLRDIASILKMNGATLDHSYIQRWVSELDLVAEWQAVLTRVGI
ncbi:MAG TPA: hypothetical protein VH475_12490 [Tepidisphaeraceae bacterium]|jgi:hypothetical protein